MTTKGGKGLGEFLIGLSEDDDRLEEYRRDPHGFLERADLDEAHKEALRSGDVRTIRTAILEEHTALSRPGGPVAPYFVITFRTD